MIGSLVEQQHVFGLFRGGDPIVEFGSLRGIGTLDGSALARVIDENAPHHLCGNRIEMPAVLPHNAVLAGESHERFVYECGGLQRVIRAFVAQIAGGAVSELMIDERDERIAGVEIPACPGAQQLAHVTGAIAHLRGPSGSS